jgi:hypothetical protein
MGLELASGGDVRHVMVLQNKFMVFHFSNHARAWLELCCWCMAASVGYLYALKLRNSHGFTRQGTSLFILAHTY